MIRLLEIQNLNAPRYYEGGLRSGHAPLVYQEHVTPEGPPALNVVTFANRLLAGGAHIHVDFHAARHFDDLRCFPGHFGSPCKWDELPPSLLKYRVDEKFASEIFYNETCACLVAAQQGRPTAAGWAGQTGRGSRASFPFPAGNAVGERWHSGETPNKELVRDAPLPIPPCCPHWIGPCRDIFSTPGSAMS